VLQGQVTALETNVAGLDASVVELQGQITAHDTRIEANRNHIVEFENEVKQGNYQAILRSPNGSIDITKPDANDPRIFNLKVVHQEEGKELILVSGNETILVDKQEDEDQKDFDLRVNLDKTTPGVISQDKSVTVKVVEADGAPNYDLSVHKTPEAVLASEEDTIVVTRIDNPETNQTGWNLEVAPGLRHVRDVSPEGSINSRKNSSFNISSAVITSHYS